MTFDFVERLGEVWEIFPHRVAGRSQRIPLPNATEQRFFRRRDRFRPALARALSLGMISVDLTECPVAHENGRSPSKTGRCAVFHGMFSAFFTRLTFAHLRNGGLGLGEPAA